jgi:energy-coupling factor transport system substrate-specific component
MYCQKGAFFMAVTEKNTDRGLLSTSIWAVGVRQIVYMALGAALYGGLSWVTNVIQLPSAGNVSLRPAIVIPLFFGAVFGPWVGLFSGGIGNLLGDYVSGYGVYWNWDVGNALLGFISGLAMLRTWGRYTSTRNIIIAEIFAAVGIIVGIGFASYTEIWLSKLTFVSATLGYLLPAAGSDLINGLILLPILLIAYNAARARLGRGY